jgi:cytochrome P450
MAAIHTTTMAATAAIYDLAAHPEYIQPLREEIQQVIDEDGQDVDRDGFMKLKKPSMPKLWKLDSFLKESQRCTPPLLRQSFLPPQTSFTNN